MKLFKILSLFLIMITLGSCGGDDDICIGGEASPRIKMKFKTKDNGKLKTLDSLFVKVDYGQGSIPYVNSFARVDSIIVPLRVDDTPFTKIFVGTTKIKIDSEITVKYTTKSEYVSPACGIKRVYENLSSELTVPSAVKGLEQNQTQIIDENKTHLYLLF